jgi:curved DNA-binding protein CbpA
MDENYYRALEVTPLASSDEIQRAYRALARRFHPDLNPRPGAAMRMASINMAYEVLSDPAKRAAYDRKEKPRNTGIDDAILRAASETLVRQGWTASGERSRDFVLKNGKKTVRVVLENMLDSAVLRRCLTRPEGFCVILAVRIDTLLRIPPPLVVIDLMHSNLYAGKFPDPTYAELFKKFLP